MAVPDSGKQFSPGAIVVDETDGEQYVKISEGAVTLATSDIEVGAVEIKDGTTDNRASVSAAGAQKVDGSAVTQPVSSTQLPAALGAQGALKVEGVASGTAQPVSGTVTANLAAGTNNIGDVDVLTLPALPAGTNNIGDVDVLTLPALPAGTNNIGDVDVLTLPAIPTGTNRIGSVQITDGTDEATVLPVRTVPATTEKGVNVNVLPTRFNNYQAVTGEVAPAITIGVKELFCFFSPAAVTQDVYITEIVVSILVTTASTTGGRTNAEVFKATSAGTGGTNVAAADIGGGLGTSAVITNSAANVMQVKTGGGALGTALIRQGLEHATQPLGTNRFDLFKSSSLEDAIILRGGSADGINIQVNRVVAHTALVDQWTASIRWIEL